MSKKTVSWEQIADILIEDFTKKDYKKDEKMMSENEMAIRFGVPRAEIRRAYERLKELGYIYSIQGCGSFFSGKKEKIRLVLTDSSSFSEKMKKLNVNYRSVNLGAERLKETSPVFGLLTQSRTSRCTKSRGSVWSIRILSPFIRAMFHRRIFRKLRKTLPPSPLYLNISKTAVTLTFPMRTAISQSLLSPQKSESC